MTTFTDLGLAAPILDALAAEGYQNPTPIQAQAIPPVLAGRDLIGIAQTGTGKTAAFALPILHQLAKRPERVQRRACRALVLSPTRELANQIADSFRAYGRNLRLKVAVVFGGVPVPRNERSVANGVDILVATPGRLLDLVDRRALTLGDVEILVLDEADQMLDLGFIHALRRIASLVPKARQSLFFSATMPRPIEQLASSFLTDPVSVAVTPVAKTADRVEQSVMMVPANEKLGVLAALLKDPALERVLVFTRTKHGADKVVRRLDAVGIRGAALHGNKSQAQRERAMAGFRDGSLKVLIATDIAARGIDVDGVSHVINFELPNVPESYVHRIGRTARAGAEGIAISLVDNSERAFLRDIERLTKQRVPVVAAPAGLAMPAPTAGERDRAQQDQRGQQERGPRRDERGPRRDGRPQQRFGERGDRQERGERGDRPENRGTDWSPLGAKPARDDRPGRPARGHGPAAQGAGRPQRQDRDRRPAADHGDVSEMPAFLGRPAKPQPHKGSHARPGATGQRPGARQRRRSAARQDAV